MSWESSRGPGGAGVSGELASARRPGGSGGSGGAGEGRAGGAARASRGRRRRGACGPGPAHLPRATGTPPRGPGREAGVSRSRSEPWRAPVSAPPPSRLGGVGGRGRTQSGG